MNKKQQKILEAVFDRPARSSIHWRDVELLMTALGAKMKEGKGSAGAFVLCRKVFPFHRPHPQKEAKQYQIRDLKHFLSELGIKP